MRYGGDSFCVRIVLSMYSLDSITLLCEVLVQLRVVVQCIVYVSPSNVSYMFCTVKICFVPVSQNGVKWSIV